MLGKEESDDNVVDTLLTGPEKEFLQKHELADLGKYDQCFPRIIIIFSYGWDNYVKKDGMQLSFEWQFVIS